MWYAVNKNGRSFLFKDKPERHYENCWFDAVNMTRATMLIIQIEITNNPFVLMQLPPMTWDDEPMEIFIISKQEYKAING